MSLYSNHSSQQSLTLTPAPTGSTAVLASVGVLLVSALVLVSTTKLPLVLPALALTSTVLAMIMGGIGYTRNDRFTDSDLLEREAVAGRCWSAPGGGPALAVGGVEDVA